MLREAMVMLVCHECGDKFVSINAEVLDVSTQMQVKVEITCAKCGAVLDTAWFEQMEGEPYEEEYYDYE